MDAVLHRIEALPGEGRYAVTFRRPDGGEQTAVAQIAAGGIDVAEASLPTGWTRDCERFEGTAEAVRAMDAARRLTSSSATLREVDGGWDVGLGNVGLSPRGTPECTAHGAMAERRGVWVCAECDARAQLW